MGPRQGLLTLLPSHICIWSTEILVVVASLAVSELQSSVVKTGFVSSVKADNHDSARPPMSGTIPIDWTALALALDDVDWAASLDDDHILQARRHSVFERVPEAWLHTTARSMDLCFYVPTTETL